MSNQSLTPTAISASQLVRSGPGRMAGIVVGSGTALTIKVWDSLTASGTVILETTVAITPSVPFLIDMPASFTVGCFVTLGGAGTVTVLTDAT